MPSRPDLVVVTLADLGEAATHRLASEASLDDAERARADAHRFRADRLRFVTGVAITKLVVAEAAGMAPADVRIDRHCAECGLPHGRPRAVGTDLHLSVSHSGDLVAVAVSRAGAVGIDVQRRHGFGRMPTEGDVLAHTELDGRPHDLIAAWCRKESVVKATGDGLRTPLTDVVLDPAHEAPRLLTYRGRPLPAHITDLHVGDGYAAAVTVLAHRPVDVVVRTVHHVSIDRSTSRPTPHHEELVAS